MAMAINAIETILCLPQSLGEWYGEHCKLLGGRPPGQGTGQWSAGYIDYVRESLDDMDPIEDHPEYWWA